MTNPSNPPADDTPTSGSPYDSPSPDTSGRPAWLLAALGAVVALLVVALGVVLLTSDDDDNSTITADGSTTTEAAADASESTSDSTVASESTVVEVVVDTTPAPDTAAETLPETTTTEVVEPDTTEPPTSEPVDTPRDIPIATPGFVWLAGSEYPIQRSCLSNPLPGYSVTSYLFVDDQGVTEIVERSRDGEFQGGFFRGGHEVEDFDDDGFGIFFDEGDSSAVISVNPILDSSDECAGTVEVTDPTNPDFPRRSGIVDVCFGNFGPDDTLGYRARIAEETELTGAANADGTLDMAYSAPSYLFAGEDPAATTTDGDGRLEIRGTVVGTPNSPSPGEVREIVAFVDQELVRDCTDAD